jgi:hypothetical protein
MAKKPVKSSKTQKAAPKPTGTKKPSAVKY